MGRGATFFVFTGYTHAPLREYPARRSVLYMYYGTNYESVPGLGNMYGSLGKVYMGMQKVYGTPAGYTEGICGCIFDDLYFTMNQPRVQWSILTLVSTLLGGCF